MQLVQRILLVIAVLCGLGLTQPTQTTLAEGGGCPAKQVIHAPDQGIWTPEPGDKLRMLNTWNPLDPSYGQRTLLLWPGEMPGLKLAGDLWYREDWGCAWITEGEFNKRTDKITYNELAAMGLITEPFAGPTPPAAPPIPHGPACKGVPYSWDVKDVQVNVPGPAILVGWSNLPGLEWGQAQFKTLVPEGVIVGKFRHTGGQFWMYPPGGCTQEELNQEFTQNPVQLAKSLDELRVAGLVE